MSEEKQGRPKKQNKYKYYKGSFVIGKKADGKPDRVYVRGKTKRERDEKLAEAKRLHARGLRLGEMTVMEWSARWMDVYKANATDVQKDHYDAKLKHDILPVVGSMRMRDVRASHLQELLNKYRGGKKGTVEKIRLAIKQLFKDATFEGIIERDPSVRLELPELDEKLRRPLTLIERKTVLNVAETHARGPFILTMLYCGLRRGECIALVRSDVDIENKKLSVNKAIVYRGNIPEVSGTKASKMRKKNRNDEELGSRVVPIPDKLFPVIVELCEGKDEDALLFPKTDGGYITKQGVRWWWQSFVRQCHISAGAKLNRNAIEYETSPFEREVTLHYLRHTYATDLYAAGVDEKARKEFLGHASNDVTDTYTTMSDEAFDRAVKLINDYYNSEKWGKNGANENGDSE